MSVARGFTVRADTTRTIVNARSETGGVVLGHSFNST
jgi:hypothetical protein